MISKRTAIILIIAIVAILIFELNFGFDRMGKMKENLDHTVAQVTLNIDGKLASLEGVAVKYEYDGMDKALTAKLGDVNQTGYENMQNNQVAYKPCALGKNTLSFTIPQEMLPQYGSDLTVSFGCENNEADFNNYSLIIDLTTIDEANIKADIAQTVYYPDENGSALNKEAEASSVVNIENSKIDCIIK